MLNDLSPAELAAAMKSGTASWGQWGSLEHHAAYVEPLGIKTLRRCRCGCRKRKTHKVAANGVALASGCEFSMYQWLRQITKSKGGS